MGVAVDAEELGRAGEDGAHLLAHLALQRLARGFRPPPRRRREDTSPARSCAAPGATCPSFSSMARTPSVMPRVEPRVGQEGRAAGSDDGASAPWPRAALARRGRSQEPRTPPATADVPPRPSLRRASRRRSRRSACATSSPSASSATPTGGGTAPHAMTAETLDRLVADLKAQEPDHIAVTGDLTNIAMREEFENARRWLEELGPPDRVTAIPGNHDAYVPGAHHRYRKLWAPWMVSDDAEYRRQGALPLHAPQGPRRADRRFLRRRLGALHGDRPRRRAPDRAADDAPRARRATEGLFRVILIHHPPKLVDPRNQWRKLTDGKRFRARGRALRRRADPARPRPHPHDDGDQGRDRHRAGRRRAGRQRPRSSAARAPAATRSTRSPRTGPATS